MSSGILLYIEEVANDGVWTTYRFYEPERDAGMLRINRDTGRCEQLLPCPGDSEERPLFSRVAAKLGRLLREGQLPKKTYWAS